jgi:hypothetical protein
MSQDTFYDCVYLRQHKKIKFSHNKTDPAKSRKVGGKILYFPVKEDGESDIGFKLRKEITFFEFFMHPVTGYVHPVFCKFSQG